jgi:hypothetical protein
MRPSSEARVGSRIAARPSWRARVTLTVLALFAGLAVSELLLRIVNPVYYAGTSTSFDYDEKTGFRLKSNVDLRKVTDHLVELRTNAIGLANFQDDLTDYRLRVFAVGDSNTMGTGNAPDQSYPFQLDLDLNVAGTGGYEKRYAVFNLGVGGFGLEQSIIRLHEYAGELRPRDTVLFFGSDNDYYDDLSFDAGHRHQQVVPGNPRWGPLVPVLLFVEDFQVQIHARRLFSRFLQARLERSRPELTSEVEQSSIAEKQWPKLSAFAREVRQAKALFVVTWAPPGVSYDWLREQARREGIPFADWVTPAQTVMAAMPGLELGNHHSANHYRPWVNRIIADAFAAQIRANDCPSCASPNVAGWVQPR